jgi:hypothetical protein
MKISEVKLTPEQSAVIDDLAQKLIILGPQDFIPAMKLWVDECVKSMRAKYPDVPEHEIESAAFRFGDLILRRFNELNVGGEGHA